MKRPTLPETSRYTVPKSKTGGDRGRLLRFSAEALYHIFVPSDFITVTKQAYYGQFRVHFGKVPVTILCIAVALFASHGCIPKSGQNSEQTKKEVEIRYKAGVRYLLEGKPAQAVQELLAAQAKSPDNADIEHALGLAYLRQDLTDRAMHQFQRALELNPNLTEARNNLGTVYLSKQKYTEAIEQFEKCMNDSGYTTPDKAAYNLGIAYSHKGEPDKAIQYFEQATRFRTNNIPALFNLGLMYDEKKDYVKALRYYRDALDLDPRLVEAHFRIGLILAKQRKFTKAAAKLRRALDIDAECLQCHLELGKVLLAQGKFQEARKHLDLIARSDPEGELGQEAREALKNIKDDPFKGIPPVSTGKHKKRR